MQESEVKLQNTSHVLKCIIVRNVKENKEREKKGVWLVMTTETVALNPTRLVIAAIIGLIILLVLIIKFKIQAMISILIVAI